MIPHHVVTGPEDAPALILINSIGSTHRMWDAQAEELARRFRLIRYDARGHGKTPPPAGPYALEDLGGDALDLLDHLGVRTASVAGLSLGGVTAMWLAINHPDRVGRVALLCTTAQHGPPEMWRDRARAAREEGVASLADLTMGRWFTEGFRERNPDAVERMSAMFASTSDEGYAGCCAVLEVTNLKPRLRSISAPTLIIAGAQDPSTPPADHARHIADGVPGARLEVIDPGSHMITVERPDVVNPLLLEHL